MTTFYCTPFSDFSGNEGKFTIATGPVVINTAGDKILLHIGESTGKWQFIGGRYDDHMTFRENARKHAHEVVGENTITLIDEEHPIILMDKVDIGACEEQTLLIHYKARIADENTTGEAKWFTLDEVRLIDAKNETSSSNVRIVAEKFL